MSVKVHDLRGFVMERLAVAADEIFALFERTFAEYEEEILRKKILQQPRDDVHKQKVQTVTVGVDLRPDPVMKDEPIRIKLKATPPIRTATSQSDEEEPGCSTDLSLDNHNKTYSCSDTDDSNEWIGRAANSHEQQSHGGFTQDSAENRVSRDDGFSSNAVRTEGSRDLTPRCSLCYKTFKNTETLEKHLEFHPGPYTCQICFKVFSSKSNYRTHLRSHTGQREKPHKCPVCGRGFLQRGHVKEHMRIHTGEKPYSCTECGKSFRQQNSLMRHVLSMHSEEKPYRCEICHKGFVQKPYFEAHMRKHTGEKPFVCLICGNRFKEKYCLKKHMSLHLEEGDITSQVIE